MDDYALPDYMSAINESLAANKALGARKKRGGFGGFLRAFAGYLGDNLTGNPVYSRAREASQQSELEDQRAERLREEAMQDYERKLQIGQRYQGPPEPPGDQRLVEWLGGLSEPERAQAIDYLKVLRPGQFTPPAPVNVPYGASIEGAGGEGGVYYNPQTGEKIHYNPATGKWEPIGGPSPGGSGGFL